MRDSETKQYSTIPGRGYAQAWELALRDTLDDSGSGRAGPIGASATSFMLVVDDSEERFEAVQLERAGRLMYRTLFCLRPHAASPVPTESDDETFADARRHRNFWTAHLAL